MTRRLRPNEMTRLTMQAGMMLVEATMVIAMRMWGMAGMWRVTGAEDALMVSEKTAAVQAAAMAAGQAIMAGKSPAVVALAAMKPVRAKTRGNVKRLALRGPGPKS